jgi:methylmalonyl-CoA/ethylmalonyl-CoA epimerase
MPPESTPPTAPDRNGRPGARIAHIGVAVAALGDAMPFYRDVLGMPEVDLADSDGASIGAVRSGESLVELLEPDGPDTPIGKFLAKRGPGIHHICYREPDLDQALEACRSAGYHLIDEVPRKGAGGRRIAFVHPKTTAGILLELTE